MTGVSPSSMEPDEVDAAFADIVARLEAERGPRAAPRADEDTGPGPADEHDETGRPAPSTPQRPLDYPRAVDPRSFRSPPPAREPREDDDVDPARPAAPAVPPTPWRADATSVVDAVLGDDDAEPFVPGPTAALPPATDRTFWLAVVGLVLGPVMLVVAVLGRDGVSPWWAWLGIGLMVVGFGALVTRLPRERDDGDDGARL